MIEVTQWPMYRSEGNEGNEGNDSNEVLSNRAGPIAARQAVIDYHI